MYFFPMLDLCPINADRPFRSFDAFRQEWSHFTTQFMTEFVQGTGERSRNRLPVVDLRYDLDGITYVKLAPPMGKPSEFWLNGRPRGNSTGITACPPVARTFPNLDAANWRRIEDHLPGGELFKGGLAKWLDLKHEQESELGQETKPLVPVAVDFEACMAWCSEHERPLDMSAVCAFANERFCDMVRGLVEQACDRSKTRIVMTEYILLVTEEIGQDKADDLSSIYYVHEGAAESRERVILSDSRLFFEHALALACAYAVKFDVGSVMYEKDLTHAWV